MSLPHDRRSFISTVASLAGLAVARASADQQPREQSAASAGGFDLAWPDQMKGKHKQLYDLGGLALAVEPRPLLEVREHRLDAILHYEYLR